MTEEEIEQLRLFLEKHGDDSRVMIFRLEGKDKIELRFTNFGVLTRQLRTTGKVDPDTVREYLLFELPIRR